MEIIVNKDWDDLSFFKGRYYRQVIQFLNEEEDAGKKILPAREDILNAFVYTPLNAVKVVILGQDPYPTTGHPMGIAFGVNPNIKPLPKSLLNIFIELKNDLGIDRKNGDLSDWAKQGVLLLNSSLTVEVGSPASHSKIGWSHLVDEALRLLNNEKKNLVFILWGAHAQTKALYVGISSIRHLVITSSHPSPLSCHVSFFGSKPFSRTNKYLKDHGIEPIQWGDLTNES